jgi:enoyl-[acyl-carrier protein] reductase II
VHEAESRGVEVEELKNILGKGRSRIGMFEGNLDDGELEIGQVSALLDQIKPAAAIVDELWQDYNQALQYGK